jgi:hypothetical protein
MTEEQVIFYTIGRVGALVSVAYIVGWSIVSAAEVLGNISTVLADKASKIRTGRE